MAGILQSISDPLVDLVIQERQLPEDMTTWLDNLSSGQFPRGRVLVHIEDVDLVLTAMRQASATPEDPRADRFLEDVAFLARMFAAVARIDIVDLRLDAICHDACWKFHRDLVEMRLLSTYRGPGT